MSTRSALASLALAASAFSMPAQAIVGGTSTTAFGQVASGVQVTPNWVLTASHLTYSPGSSFSDGYGSSTVAAVYHYSVNGFPEDDLTLLRLDTAIAAPSLSVNATALAAGTGYNVDATIVTGLNQVPRGYAFATVREFVPLVDPDDAGPLAPVSANWLLTGPGDPYVESGDSGGALFIGHVTDANSLTPLWGITSSQLYDEDESGNRSNYRSGFVQLANYRSWIDATMAGDLADTQQISWVTSAVPETSTALMALLGLAGLAGLRRFRPRSPTR
jgi:MYXO-CTERM domain-containing protein